MGRHFPDTDFDLVSEMELRHAQFWCGNLQRFSKGDPPPRDHASIADNPIAYWWKTDPTFQTSVYRQIAKAEGVSEAVARNAIQRRSEREARHAQGVQQYWARKRGNTGKAKVR
jgi:hypothetical protein